MANMEETMREPCNASEEMTQNQKDEAVTLLQSNTDCLLQNANRTDVSKAPFKLLDLPLVLVRDILNHVVQSYTIHQSLNLGSLLSLKQINRTFPYSPFQPIYADQPPWQISSMMKSRII